MQEQMLQKAKNTAVKAVLAAGTILRELFGRDITILEKGQDGDLVTEADHKAEAAILAVISSEFPDHQIRSEETGWSGVESDWLWLVDPLDGTNNFAIQLPVYGVSVTLLYKRIPLLGVIYDPVLDKLYVAEKGKGAYCNGKRLSVSLAGQGRQPGKMTLAWIQGHQVQKEERALHLKQYLDKQCKRVIRLWAPTLIWCATARGDIDAIVLYNSEGDDLYSGVLIAKEAGAEVIDFEGQPFEGMNSEPYIIACRPGEKDVIMRLVHEGMRGNP